jgi:nitrite reductase/ring-hydroxylating ferredoxin subunit
MRDDRDHHKAEPAEARWHPVTRSAEAVPRHILHIQLLGQELAVWRDDQGRVNAWENRCPHRGLRLSLGNNTGAELQCRYHGWRFESGAGRCSYIPAHPGQTPAKAIQARPFACVEKYGFVWVKLESETGGASPPDIEAFESCKPTALRAMFINARAAAVAEALAGYRFSPNAGASVAAASIRILAPLTIAAIAASEGMAATVIFMLQPVSQESCCIHGALVGAVSDAERIAVLRHHNDQLTDLCNRLESITAISQIPHQASA